MGFFVAIEGPEGAGKSTLAQALHARALAQPWPALVTRNPGATPLGERLRALLLDPHMPTPHPEAELLLYLADRAQHVREVLKPALAQGTLVLCDRFTDSTLAYQGQGRGFEPGPLAELAHRWGALGLVPDLTLVLDLEPELGLARAQGRGPADRLEAEGLAFHRRVREAFLAQAKSAPERYHVLTAALPPEQLLDAAWLALTAHLPPHWSPAHVPST